MVIPWQELDQTNMAVVTASQIFLPKPVVTFIVISALFAAATSVNGIMLGLSRDFYQGARSGLYPAAFASVQATTHVPVRSVILVGVLALSGTFVGGAITSYAQLALIGIMVIQIMTGVSLIRMPTVMPDVYQKAKFKLGRKSLVVVSLLYIAFSGLFIFLLAAEKPRLLLIGLVFLLVGLIYQQLWARFFQSKSSE